MRLNVMLEPQEGMRYRDLTAVAQRAEQLGVFDAMYRSDHYTSTSGRTGVRSTDAWATLAGLARETERIKLGTLVSPVSFRSAGNLAKVVATVAEMAGRVDGEPRIHLGLGTGWLEREHEEFGFPFEDIGTRFARLEEHLQVVRGLWSGSQPFSFQGRFVHIEAAHFSEHPDPLPRVIVGGSGRVRTPRLAARYADELNTIFQSPDGCRTMRQAMDAACETEGRDPASLPLTLMTGCLVGATRVELEQRARRLLERRGDGHAVGDFLDRQGATAVIGTPGQALERIAALGEVGVEAVMLQHLLYDDLDMLELIATEIAPHLP